MNTADMLRYLAYQIENKPAARGAIAEGFRLIADAMGEPAPCEDCASQQGARLDPADDPSAGADPAAVVEG